MNGEKLKYFKQLQSIYSDEIFLSFDDSVDGEINFLNSRTKLSELPLDENGSRDCIECSSLSSKKSFIAGSGDTNASLFLITETLDENELINGEPVFEKAGTLLDKMLHAINMSRNEDVFICDALKQPLSLSRKLKKTPKIECECYLVNQIDLIQPKLIVALGRFAAKTLLGVEKPLKEMRGRIHKYHSKSLIITYHPAALLRNSNWKPEAWEDFKWIRELLKK